MSCSRKMSFSSKFFALSQCVGSKAIFSTAVCKRMSSGQQPIVTALEKLKDIAITPDQANKYKEAVKIYNRSDWTAGSRSRFKIY